MTGINQYVLKLIKIVLVMKFMIRFAGVTGKRIAMPALPSVMELMSSQQVFVNKNIYP